MTKPEGQNISSEHSQNKYFTMLENLSLLELKPFQLALYANYKRTCGNSTGKTFKSNQTLATETHMSKRQVQTTRNELEKLGYIKVHQKPDEKGNVNKPPDVILCDIMPKNVSHFSVPHAGGATPLADDATPHAQPAPKEELSKKNSLKKKEKESTLRENTSRDEISYQDLEIAIKIVYEARDGFGTPPKTIDEFIALMPDPQALEDVWTKAKMNYIDRTVAEKYTKVQDLTPKSDPDEIAKDMSRLPWKGGDVLTWTVGDDTTKQDTEAEQANKEKPKTTPASIMNPLKDAIVLAFGWDSSNVTKNEWGKIITTAKQLADVNIEPAQVSALYKYCKDVKKFTQFSPVALTTVVSDWRASRTNDVQNAKNVQATQDAMDKQFMKSAPPPDHTILSYDEDES